MNSRLKLVLISSLYSAVALAQTWNIEGVNFSVDTLYSATVGPGTVETELRITSVGTSAPVVDNIFFTVVDLTNPYLEMRAAKGGNHVRKLEIVPEIAERMSQPGELYFTGVNADFFNMKYPYNICGSCVAGGFPTNYGSDYWEYIVFDEKGVPTLAENINFPSSGTVKNASGTSSTFKINKERAADELILYTPQWQREGGDLGRTGTNRYGTEVKLRPIGDNIIVGNELRLEVVGDAEVSVGNMTLPSDGYVLSAHGAAQSAINQLRNGDVVTATIPFTADGNAMKVKELLGGRPVMLKNNVVQPTSNAIDHLKNIEPRTAVGYNSDKSKLYMAVVDGRNAGGSNGVTQRELATIMRYLGCSDALNFDGGGSSTMYVHGLGIKNVPSSSSLDNRPEGVPRTVVNALFAVAVAPVDNNIASIEIREKKAVLSVGQSYTPVVYGYNQYGVMVDTDLKDFTVTVPEQLGTVSGTTFKAGEGQYTGALTVDYQGKTYSIPVSINGAASGVDEVMYDSTDGTDEYYQLNGVRTSEPVRGQINIVRRGNTVSKTVR